MTNKYVLFTNIRGVIDEQLAIYNATKACGYKIIMLAPSIPEHLKSLTDLYLVNDNKDEVNSLARSLDLADKYNIEAVFSWTDTDVVLCSKIARALGISSIDVDAAYLARNKYEMRKTIFNHHPALVPLFAEISSIEDIEKHISKIGFPAVLKPISASGSKGIFKIHTLDEAFAAFENLTALSDDAQEGWFYNRYGQKFILESFLLGQEFSVEGVVLNNEIFIAGITDKMTTSDWHLEYRHIFPANYPEDICVAIEAATKKIIRALGMNHCPFHLEGKWTDDGFKLIEIAARIGGDLIHTHLIKNSLNFNWLTFVIRSLTEKKFPAIPETSPRRYSGIQFILAQDELPFAGLNTLSSADNINGVIKIEELVPRGAAIVAPPQDFAMQRVGYVVAESNDFASLEQLLNTISVELTT
ncbi:MAG: ATP-grasp domain-containing protein [Legionella sp.]|nr:ATP-grasp domain-containing protein [Legionella sp.]